MQGPQPQPGVMNVHPYVPGGADAAPGPGVIRLSLNEQPLGPSPAAVDAYVESASGPASGLGRYPDGSAARLREALADRYGLEPERIVCAAGSEEFLYLLARGYLGPGTEGLYSANGFLVYRIATEATGATPVAAPERAFAADVDALLASVTARTRVVFLANPNNPTGTWLPWREVQRLHAGLPSHVVLVLDAAYAEFIQHPDYADGSALAREAGNVVMLRTFSKAYGLAGARLGWAYGAPAIIEVLNRLRAPFNVSGPAIAAGIAALRDQAHLDRVIAHNTSGLARLQAGLGALQVAFTPSVANFVLAHFGTTPGCDARAAAHFLAERGILVRPMAGYELRSSLRLTIGTAAETMALLEALEQFSAAANGAGR
jgi:histidinol-phosphate aminotransferase